jgi:hypothetical protein
MDDGLVMRLRRTALEVGERVVDGEEIRELLREAARALEEQDEELRGLTEAWRTARIPDEPCS